MTLLQKLGLLLLGSIPFILALWATYIDWRNERPKKKDDDE